MNLSRYFYVKGPFEERTSKHPVIVAFSFLGDNLMFPARLVDIRGLLYTPLAFARLSEIFSSVSRGTIFIDCNSWNSNLHAYLCHTPGW